MWVNLGFWLWMMFHLSGPVGVVGFFGFGVLLWLVSDFLEALWSLFKKADAKKIGIILCLIGLFIPLASLAFTEGYDPKAGTLGNVLTMKVVIKQGKWVGKWVPPAQPSQLFRSFEKAIKAGGYYEGRLEFFYKSLLLAGLVFTFMGGGMILLSDRSTKGGVTKGGVRLGIPDI